MDYPPLIHLLTRFVFTFGLSFETYFLRFRLGRSSTAAWKAGSAALATAVSRRFLFNPIIFIPRIKVVVIPVVSRVSLTARRITQIQL